MLKNTGRRLLERGNPKKAGIRALVFLERHRTKRVVPALFILTRGRAVGRAMTHTAFYFSLALGLCVRPCTANQQQLSFPLNTRVRHAFTASERTASSSVSVCAFLLEEGATFGITCTAARCALTLLSKFFSRCCVDAAPSKTGGAPPCGENAHAAMMRDPAPHHMHPSPTT